MLFFVHRCCLSEEQRCDSRQEKQNGCLAHVSLVQLGGFAFPGPVRVWCVRVPELCVVQFCGMTAKPTRPVIAGGQSCFRRRMKRLWDDRVAHDTNDGW
jgi:hypothetical protein